PVLRELHAALLQQVGSDHPERLRALSHLGNALYVQGKYAEADTVLTELVADTGRARGSEHGATLLAMKRLALARGRNGQLPAAIEIMRGAAEISGRTNGPGHITTLNYLKNLAGMLVIARRYEEALAPAGTAYATALREFGPDGPSTVADAVVFADALDHAGRGAEALPIWRETAESLVRLRPDEWNTHYVRGQFGRALVRAGQPAAAEPVLRESYAALLARQAKLPPARRRAPDELAAQLAHVYTALGRADEAAEWQAKVSAAPSPISAAPPP
ncbi:MAG: hypothetical protein RLZZ15_2847, partial [Verrucomicrobiota bacterium]